MMMRNQAIPNHPGKTLKSDNKVRLIDCQLCGYIHADPIPHTTDLEKLYTSQFYDNDRPQYLDKMEREQDYWRDVVYRDRYDYLERLLSDSNYRRILDIGCSGGFFLKYGQELGWDVLGIEPSHQAAQYAREVMGIPVIENTFQNVTPSDLAPLFDVVHLRNVLEHLPNPVELCEQAYAFLKPGGIICIEVPNDFNPMQQLAQQYLGTSDYWVSVPHHLNYFTPQSLGQLMERCGFKIAHRESTFPIEFFLLMGEHYVGNEEVGLACHTKRMNFEQAMSQTEETLQLKRKMYEFFSEVGLGRTIILYGQKTEASGTE